jgi:sodium/potassium/calcium exchanger 6
MRDVSVVGYYLALVALLLSFFYILYVSSDQHLCVALQLIANFLKMSPQVAGLTFLAFGNGAPDFFTALSGAKEKPVIILGASVGGGLFITLFVLGAVIFFSKLPNDSKSLPEHVQKTAAIQSNRRKMMLNGLQALNPSLNKISFLKNSILYLSCVFTLLTVSLTRSIPLWLPIVFVVMYVLHLISAFFIGNYERRLEMKRNSTRIELSVLATEENLVEEKEESSKGPEDLKSVSVLVYESLVTPFLEKTLFQKIRAIISLPAELLCSLSVPPLLEEGYTKVDLLFYRLRLVMNPWFSGALIMFVFRNILKVYPSGVPAWGVYLIVCPLVSAILFFTTSLDKPPRYEKLIVVYAFAVCIVWIYAISNEVILILSVLGFLLNIRDAVLGLTVLAWGNSFGDFVADLSVANAGGFETALTAIFCGPVQNILMTLGVSFIIVFAGGESVEFGDDLLTDAFIGFGFLIAGLVLTITMTAFKFKFRIPKYYGVFLITMYMIYCVVGLVYGLGLTTPEVADPL